MRVFKKLGWKTLKVLLHIFEIVRFVGILLCAYTSIGFYGGKVLVAFLEYSSLESVPNNVFFWIIFWALIGLALAFCAQFMNNAHEWVDERIFESTTFYFSKEKLERFKMDALDGNLEHYTFDEILKMTKALEDKGEKLVTDSSRYNSGEQTGFVPSYEVKKEKTRTEDEEKIISSQEIKNFTHAGVSDPMKELDELMGLDNVKEQVRKMQTRYLFEARRKEQGVSTKLSTCNHM